MQDTDIEKRRKNLSNSQQCDGRRIKIKTHKHGMDESEFGLKFHIIAKLCCPVHGKDALIREVSTIGITRNS